MVHSAYAQKQLYISNRPKFITWLELKPQGGSEMIRVKQERWRRSPQQERGRRTNQQWRKENALEQRRRLK